MISPYWAAVSRSEGTAATSIFASQPAPYGSELIVSGELDNESLIATTVPVTGA